MEVVLEALQSEPSKITRGDTVWKFDGNITTEEAIWFMSTDSIRGSDFLVKASEVVSRAMLPYHPECSPKKVREMFTPTELMRILTSFLTQLGLTVGMGSSTLTTANQTRKSKRQASKR